MHWKCKSNKKISICVWWFVVICVKNGRKVGGGGSSLIYLSSVEREEAWIENLVFFFLIVHFIKCETYFFIYDSRHFSFVLCSLNLPRRLPAATFLKDCDHISYVLILPLAPPCLHFIHSSIHSLIWLPFFTQLKWICRANFASRQFQPRD